MAKSKRIKFNVKNVKYALLTDGEYGAPIDLAYANSLTLEADYNEQKIYGDGQVIAILSDDKGKTGTLSVVDINDDYEVACGRKMILENGIADIQQHSSVVHAIYYEVEALDGGVPITIKNWLFGCVTGKANESYQQTADDPTVNTYDYPLSVMGTEIKAATGETDYVDKNGNTIKATQLTSYPDDLGFEEFGTTVPTPKAKAGL